VSSFSELGGYARSAMPVLKGGPKPKICFLLFLKGRPRAALHAELSLSGLPTSAFYRRSDLRQISLNDSGDIAV
jgi:hypothetical protein